MAKDTRPGGNRQEPDARSDKQDHKTKIQNTSSVGNGSRVVGELKQYIVNKA